MNPGPRFTNVVLRATDEVHLRTLKDLAEFWKIPYSLQSSPNSTQVVVSSGQISETDRASNKPMVVSPAGQDDARKISQKFDLELSVRKTLVRLPFSPSAKTAIIPVLYDFKGPGLETIIESNGISILSRVKDSKAHLLSIDLASEYELRINGGLEDSPSLKFRLATRLPLSYKLIPSSIRNRAFRSADRPELNEEKLAPVECLRALFLASIVTVAESPVPRIGFWRRGKKFALAVTHDVETKKGLLNGSQQLLGIEEDLRIRSTWNIITNRYPLTHQILNSLATSGEIGGHDTDHDGRLIFLPVHARIERLRSCREKLERISQAKVRGFRAPLLQHDKALVAAVGKAGYEFDSSVPSWELLSPTSLKSHGVGTVFPFEIEGVLEVPVSLPQDHQLLRVSGMTTREAGDTLLRTSKWIRDIGGMCTLLVHPDYDFALEDQGTQYSRILRTFREDPLCQIITLGEATDWWTLRRNAYLENSNGDLRVRSTATQEQVKNLEMEAVTSYGPHGFSVEHLN